MFDHRKSRSLFCKTFCKVILSDIVALDRTHVLVKFKLTGNSKKNFAGKDENDHNRVLGTVDTVTICHQQFYLLCLKCLPSKLQKNLKIYLIAVVYVMNNVFPFVKIITIWLSTPQ